MSEITTKLSGKLIIAGGTIQLSTEIGDGRNLELQGDLSEGKINFKQFVKELLEGYELELPDNFPELEFDTASLTVVPRQRSVATEASVSIDWENPLGVLKGVTVKKFELSFSYDNGNTSISFDIQVNYAGREAIDGSIDFIDGSLNVVALELYQELSIADFLKYSVPNVNWGELLPVSFKPINGRDPMRLYYAKEAIETFKQGFNIDQTVIKIIDFDAEVLLNVHNKVVTITGQLMSPIDLLDLGFLVISGPDFEGSPQVSVSTSPRQFILKSSYTFFQKQFGSADLTVQKSGSDYEFNANLSYDGHIGPFDNPSCSFTWSKNKGFKIENWPSTDQLEPDIRLIEQIQNISKESSCGELVDLVFREEVKTKFNVQPSFSTTGNSFKILLEGSYEIRWYDCEIVTVDFPKPIEIPIESPNNFSFDQIEQLLVTGIEEAAKSLVQALINEPAKALKFFAVAFAPEIVKKLADKLICTIKAVSEVIVMGAATLTQIAEGVNSAFISAIEASVGLAAAVAAAIAFAHSSVDDEDGSSDDEDGSSDDEDGSSDDEDGSSDDEDGSGEPENPKPPNLDQLTYANGEVTGTWTPVAHATGYKFRLVRQGNDAPIGGIQSTPQDQIWAKVNIPATEKAGTFIGQACSVAKGFESDWGESLSITKLEAPTVTQLTYANGSATAEWNNVANNDGYQLRIVNAEGEVVAEGQFLLDTTSGSVELDSDLDAGEYYAQVSTQAANEKTIPSNWSSPSSALHKLPAPDFESVNVDNLTVSVSWTQVSNNGGYCFQLLKDGEVISTNNTEQDETEIEVKLSDDSPTGIYQARLRTTAGNETFIDSAWTVTDITFWEWTEPVVLSDLFREEAIGKLVIFSALHKAELKQYVQITDKEGTPIKFTTMSGGQGQFPISGQGTTVGFFNDGVGHFVLQEGYQISFANEGENLSKFQYKVAPPFTVVSTVSPNIYGEAILFAVEDSEENEEYDNTTVTLKSYKKQGGTMPEDNKIVRAAIHPGIGIARVGNSTAEGEKGYYIGPEVTEPPLMGVNNRDENGAIKRQAARFRIYGYNAAGEVVKELKGTDADTAIEWTAHLANRKAQWYKFVVALDLPEAPDILDSLKIPQSPYQPSEHRNPSLRGAAREQLAIDPGPRTIAGQSGQTPQRFDNGTFLTGEHETTVYLGELRTDEHGRLLVLGGFGKSASPTGDTVYNPNDPSGFVNPDNWYDDISDGPVTATVTIDSQPIPVESSWVVVAPPNYAPGIIGWRTLYDLLVDTYVECGWMPMPTTASFTKDILPVLSRLSNLQWVNKGFATLFGKGCPLDFSDPELLEKLAYKGATEEEDLYHELRQIVFNTFRPAETESNTGSSWPWIYGDGFGSAPESSPSNNLALSKVRMELMKLWVDGNFENDYTPDFEQPISLEEVALQEQPGMLDKAALHFCLADAFHPGCELTWPMRHSSLYSAPFRVRHAEDTANTEQDYGRVLTQEIVLRPGGPLYAQGAGDLTRWMGIPWQADTGFCRSGYDTEYDPYLPTFWPANVPNQILTEESYEIVTGGGSDEDKLKAFYSRDNWLRALPATTIEAMLYMVNNFALMGIIELREGLEDNPDIPSKIFVESLHPEQVEELRTLLAASEPARLALPSKIRRAGWNSIEQLEEFRQIRFGNR